MNSTLQLQINQLQYTAHCLLHIGDDTGYVYADELSRLNHELHEQIYTLYGKRGKTIEQEAVLCYTLLMAYSVSMYANPSDESKKQVLLERSWRILNKLPDALLKCQLAVYCYGEVYDKELAIIAHNIIRIWGNKALSSEEQEIIETLRVMEETPYPSYEEVK